MPRFLIRITEWVGEDGAGCDCDGGRDGDGRNDWVLFWAYEMSNHDQASTWSCGMEV